MGGWVKGGRAGGTHERGRTASTMGHASRARGGVIIYLLTRRSRQRPTKSSLTWRWGATGCAGPSKASSCICLRAILHSKSPLKMFAYAWAPIKMPSCICLRDILHSKSPLKKVCLRGGAGPPARAPPIKMPSCICLRAVKVVKVIKKSLLTWRWGATGCVGPALPDGTEGLEREASSES